MRKTVILAKIAKLAKIAILATLATLASCNTDELCYSHPHTDEYYLKFVWDDTGDARPEGMRVWLYPQTGADPYFADINAESDSVNVFEGNYHILAYNNDTEWISFTGTDTYHTHTMTTRDGGLLEPMGAGYRGVTLLADNDDDRIAVAPEPVYAAGMENVTVHHRDTVVLRPQPLHCDYTYEIRNVGKSLKYVAQISAAISGMADGVNVTTGELTSTTCTIPVTADPGADGNSITGSFHTFGHHPSNTRPHRMSVFVVMEDGRQFKYVSGDYLDVTRQIDEAPDPRHVHIVIEGLKLPVAIENGSGFSVDLTDWEEVNREIEM